MTEGEPLIRWDWIASHLDEFAFRFGEHVELTVIAVGVGFVIAFALSLLILRAPRTEGPITAVTSLIGQGGFGFLILIGIQRFFTTELIAGAVLSVALAIVADALLVLLQRRLTPWARAA